MAKRGSGGKFSLFKRVTSPISGVAKFGSKTVRRVTRGVSNVAKAGFNTVGGIANNAGSGANNIVRGVVRGRSRRNRRGPMTRRRRGERREETRRRR